jgi:hypothetical protein
MRQALEHHGVRIHQFFMAHGPYCKGAADQGHHPGQVPGTTVASPPAKFRATAIVNTKIQIIVILKKLSESES